MSAPTAASLYTGAGAEHGVYEQGRQWARVEYGAGCAAAIDAELNRLGVERAFLLSTPSIVRAGLLQRVRQPSGPRLAGEFLECRAHVPETVVAEAAAAAVAAGADGLVAIGGSSVIDTAKAVALLQAEGGAPSEESFAALRAAGTGAGPVLPVLALPTTLSGGEFTGVVATTDAQGVKHLLPDPRLAPRSILLDPELTAATPDPLWRATGVKTISDAVEQIAYGATPATDALCARGIEFFLGSLATGADDLAARLRCQQAAWMSLFGLHDAGSSVGLGAALRHQVAVTCGAGHGEVTCVLLPHVVRFNAAAAAERAAAVAPAFGLSADGDGALVWEAVARRLEEFIRDLDLPTRLAQIVAREADLEALAERVVNERPAQLNPRRASAPEIVELLRGAW